MIEGDWKATRGAFVWQWGTGSYAVVFPHPDDSDFGWAAFMGDEIATAGSAESKLEAMVAAEDAIHEAFAAGPDDQRDERTGAEESSP